MSEARLPLPASGEGRGEGGGGQLSIAVGAVMLPALAGAASNPHPSPLPKPEERAAQIITVVIPCYNEAEVLPAFHARLTAALTSLNADLIYVNDGSTDATLQILRSLPGASVLNLSRNFGKEAAATAGIDRARGDAVILIDADLQDPPELIPEMVAAWHQGFDMVYAQRRARAGETWFKKTSAAYFYRLMQGVGRVPLPPDTGDFRLMSRRVVEAVGQLREQHRFMKGIFAWVGFPSCAVLYDREPRAAGVSKWSYWRLWNFAIDGITGFTVMPLKIATYMGLVVALAALLYGLAILLNTFLYGNPVPGYPSLVVIVLFLGGVQLMTLGVIGEYLGRVFNETKQRPLYLVESFQSHQPDRN